MLLHTKLETGFDIRATNSTNSFCPQVKGYRYLEEDNSDESDSERSEEDDREDEREEDDCDVVQNLDGEERDQEGWYQGANSPRARRRGAEGRGQDYARVNERDGEIWEEERKS